jgi:hypothetical protein
MDPFRSRGFHSEVVRVRVAKAGRETQRRARNSRMRDPSLTMNVD